MIDGQRDRAGAVAESRLGRWLARRVSVVVLLLGASAGMAGDPAPYKPVSFSRGPLKLPWCFEMVETGSCITQQEGGTPKETRRELRRQVFVEKLPGGDRIAIKVREPGRGAPEWSEVPPVGIAHYRGGIPDLASLEGELQSLEAVVLSRALADCFVTVPQGLVTPGQAWDMPLPDVPDAFRQGHTYADRVAMVAGLSEGDSGPEIHLRTFAVKFNPANPIGIPHDCVSTCRDLVVDAATGNVLESRRVSYHDAGTVGLRQTAVGEIVFRRVDPRSGKPLRKR